MNSCRVLAVLCLAGAAIGFPRPVCAQIFHLPIPGLSVPGIATEAAAKQLAPYFEANQPVIRDWSALYPTVPVLPGEVFRPTRTRSAQFVFERAVISQLRTSQNGIVTLARGDYVLPVRVFCTDIHRHANAPFAYLLGPLRGTRAGLLTRMYAHASSVDPPFGNLQRLSWSLQDGLSYSQLDPSAQSLFTQLLPGEQSAIAQSFLDALQGRWNAIASTTPGLPGFDQAIGQMGAVGNSINDIRSAQSTLLSDADDFDALRSSFVLGPTSAATDGDISSTPWSVPWNGTYIRLLTEGAFGSLGLLEIRVSSERNRVPVTDNIGYPPRCLECQPLTMRPKYKGAPKPPLHVTVSGDAPARSVSPGTGRIAFYGDIGSIINNQNPLLVRPSTLLLAEDGSVALIHLRWSGWGTSVARATGVWSASNCTPSCANGKRTTSPARLTLSSPGLGGGHRVYRCFQIYPPHPQRDIDDHGCIQRQGTYAVYAPISGP